jgi:Mrp family chromosome partitioning ATPase
MIKDNDVIAILRKVFHPEYKKSLIDLGMIENIRTNHAKVEVDLLLPFDKVPVKDQLISSIINGIVAIESSADVEVNEKNMSQQQRAFFMTAIEGGPKRAQRGNKIGKVIAVISGKGGVGKSSTTGMLAVALNKLGKKVGVLDADITGPSIPKMFGIHGQPEMGPVGILPPSTENGIKAISVNLLLPDENTAVIWRGPIISNTIKQFYQEVSWGELDYLILDLPPGTSDATLTVLQSIPLDGVVLVTSPQDLAGMIVRKSANMINQMNARIIGVLENMSYVICPKCGEKMEVFGPSNVNRITEQLDIPLLGQIPLDPQLALHCDQGKIEDYQSVEMDEVAEYISTL